MALEKNQIEIPGPVVCVVMDGVGLGRKDDGDAVHLAHTPVLDHLAQRSPFVSLRAHGTAVGLPSDEDMGNSEVGHNALGAGRIFDQGAKLVNAAIESGRIWEGPWRECIAKVKASGEPLHLLSALERRSHRWDHDLDGARSTLSAANGCAVILTGIDFV